VAESFGTVLCSLRQNCLQEILEREEIETNLKRKCFSTRKTRRVELEEVIVFWD